MSDYYSFLAVTCDMNQGPYLKNVLLIIKAFDLYLNRIGDLFFIIDKDFFPNDLRGKKTFIFIGQLIFWEIRRALRQLRQNRIKQRIEVKVFKCGNRYNW